MPRKAKTTMTGQPGQPTAPVPGQTYGMGVEQQQLAEALPSPQVRAAATQPTAVTATAPPGASAPPAPPAEVQQAPMSHEQMVQMAAKMRPQTGLFQGDTNRPDEPITAGLNNPALAAQSPMGDMLRRLSQQSGDPIFSQMAARFKT